MLNRISISHVWVLDQDQALDFYVNKLGLEVRSDQNLGFMRWLTVGVPGDTGREILLELPAPPSVDNAAADQIRELVSKGATGFAVGFTTDNCRETYETLLARGVEFTQEPVERDYGTDIGLRSWERPPHGHGKGLLTASARSALEAARTSEGFHRNDHVTFMSCVSALHFAEQASRSEYKSAMRRPFACSITSSSA